jgi:hypothetical protein
MKPTEVVEKIFDIEKELNLFDQKISGVYFWKLIRLSIFSKINEKLGTYEQAHNKEQNSHLQKIKSIYPKLKNTYLYSVFSRTSEVDTLVFEHGRKVLVDGEYVDIYTYYKVDELENKNASYEIVDRPYLSKHYHLASTNRSYSECFSFNYLFKKYFSKVKLDKPEQELLNKLEDKIEKTFGLKIILNSLVSNKIKMFKVKKNQYIKMLRKRSVKKVYIVVSYIYEDLVAACQELGIECIELQHGSIIYHHLGYSFPHNKKIPYFPEKLELFGEYWYDSTPIPVEHENISVVGYPYLSKMLGKYKDVRKVKNRIVFVSQGTVATGMSKVALGLAKDNKDLEVYYKLHPGEFGRWKEEYINLIEAQRLENVHIIESELHLYEVMAFSEYLVGVYSTAIYEGLVLNCKTILLKLNGIEFMNDLIEKKIVKIAESSGDIENLMQNENFKKIDSEYFFKGALNG